jgi:hypothetical protein
MSKFHRLGATGKFPYGKLNPDDEGELKMAIGIDNGAVRIDFGKQIKWLALPPAEATQLGWLLINNADKIKQGAS